MTLLIRQATIAVIHTAKINLISFLTAILFNTSSRICNIGLLIRKVVDRPKALGDIRGMTYIYGMFYRFGLIDVPDEVKAKMGHPKNHKKNVATSIWFVE